jgi:phage terminase small subunit
MALAPHNKDRPESASVRRALEADDMDALRDALSYRQRRFCEEYVIDFKGSAAAIRAGYAPKWADRQAHLLMLHRGVERYIDHLQMSKESKIVSISPDYLIQKLMDIMARPGIRTADELRAIEMAMKHLGMFVDRTEITGKDGDAIRIEQQKVEANVNDFLAKIKTIQDRQKKDVVIP